MEAPTGDLHARIGISRLDITPPAGIHWKLWGASLTETAEGVHRPLTATAMAILGDDEPLVVVSLDVCEWSDPADERLVRERILSGGGLDPDRLLLHSTHTHSGQAPCTSNVALAGGEYIGEHLELIADRAATAVARALASAVPSVLSWGVGHCGLAAHRDQIVAGRAVVGYDPGVAADDTVLVGRVTTTAGKLTAVIVSYACHPTVLGWGNRLISPDYVGAMRELVEDQHPDALTLFLQGASGELAPARQYRDDPADADKAGRALGHAVEATLDLMPPADHRLVPVGVIESGAPLGVWAEQPVRPNHLLSVRRLDLKLARKTAAPAAPADLPAHVRAERLARAELVNRSAGTRVDLTYPVWVWELGPLVLVAHPGEAYSWLATTLRLALAPRPVLVANLTNGAGAFYLPPRQAYEQPRYTVDQTPAGPGSLELMAEAVLAEFSTTATSSLISTTIQEP